MPCLAVAAAHVAIAQGQRQVPVDSARRAVDSGPATPNARAAHTWSTPRAFADMRPGLAVRFPSLSRHGGTAWVAANVLPTRAGAPVAAPTGTLLRSGAPSIPLPSEARTFAFPRGVHDGRGDYHLVWAEADTAPRTAAEWPGRLRLLWYARRRFGRWDRVQLLHRAERLVWLPNSGDVALGQDGALHVVVGSSQGGEAPHLTHVVIREDRVVAGTLPRIPVLGVSITAVRGLGLAVAYVAQQPRAAGGGSTAVVQTSRDSGRTWSAPHAIREFIAGAAPALQLRSSGDRLHLAMTMSDAGTVFPNAVGYLHARFGRSDWDSVSPIGFQEQVISQQSVASSCGTLFTVVETLAATPGGPRVRLYEIDWSATGRRPISIYPRYDQAAAPAITSAAGRLLMLWSGRRTPSADLRLLASTRRVCGSSS